MKHTFFYWDFASSNNLFPHFYAGLIWNKSILLNKGYFQNGYSTRSASQNNDFIYFSLMLFIRKIHEKSLFLLFFDMMNQYSVLKESKIIICISIHFLASWLSKLLLR